MRNKYFKVVKCFKSICICISNTAKKVIVSIYHVFAFVVLICISPQVWNMHIMYI